MKAIPLDYDDDPERFRTNVKSVANYSLVGDVHEDVVVRLLKEDTHFVLDMGCGEGRFTQPARAGGLQTVAFDYSRTMLTAVTAPRIQGDACHLPFMSNHFGAVVALYMLYHLKDPRLAVAESWRVLQSGGLFVTCAPSRFNDPELASVLTQATSTFDAENGLEMVAEYFEDVEVERWDAPLVHLSDKAALTQYLRGRHVAADQETVNQIETPLTLTKRGALFIARKK